jgi:hypothetical protein
MMTPLTTAQSHSDDRGIDMKSLFRIEGDTLVPDSEMGLKWLRGASRKSQYVEVNHTSVRSKEQHDFFFGPVLHAFWANLSDEHQDHYGDIQNMRRHILISLGYFTESKTGVPIPESMNFGNMDDARFQEFLQRFEGLVGKVMGITLDELVKGAAM